MSMRDTVDVKKLSNSNVWERSARSRYCTQSFFLRLLTPSTSALKSSLFIFLPIYNEVKFPFRESFVKASIAANMSSSTSKPNVPPKLSTHTVMSRQLSSAPHFTSSRVAHHENDETELDREIEVRLVTALTKFQLMRFQIHVQRETVISAYENPHEYAPPASLFRHCSDYTLKSPVEEPSKVVPQSASTPTSSPRKRDFMRQRKLDLLTELIALDKKIRAGCAEWERMLREGSVSSTDQRLQRKIKLIEEKYKNTSVNDAIRNNHIWYSLEDTHTLLTLLTHSPQ